MHINESNIFLNRDPFANLKLVHKNTRTQHKTQSAVAQALHIGSPARAHLSWRTFGPLNRGLGRGISAVFGPRWAERAEGRSTRRDGDQQWRRGRTLPLPHQHPNTSTTSHSARHTVCGQHRATTNALRLACISTSLPNSSTQKSTAATSIPICKDSLST